MRILRHTIALGEHDAKIVRGASVSLHSSVLIIRFGLIRVWPIKTQPFCQHETGTEQCLGMALPGRSPIPLKRLRDILRGTSSHTQALGRLILRIGFAVARCLHHPGKSRRFILGNTIAGE